MRPRGRGTRRSGAERCRSSSTRLGFGVGEEGERVYAVRESCPAPGTIGSIACVAGSRSVASDGVRAPFGTTVGPLCQWVQAGSRSGTYSARWSSGESARLGEVSRGVETCRRAAQRTPVLGGGSQARAVDASPRLVAHAIGRLAPHVPLLRQPTRGGADAAGRHTRPPGLSISIGAPPAVSPLVRKDRSTRQAQPRPMVGPRAPFSRPCEGIERPGWRGAPRGGLDRGLLKWITQSCIDLCTWVTTSTCEESCSSYLSQPPPSPPRHPATDPAPTAAEAKRAVAFCEAFPSSGQ